MPGAVATLTHLPGVSWAIVTSCGDTLARARLEAAFLPIPRVLIASERIDRGKPFPDGYLAGARGLHVSATDCIVFEDTPPGIEAGLAAGAQVVGLSTTYDGERLTAATRVVRDLSEVHIGRAGTAAGEFHVLLG
jgi:sugar-phosphatase